MSLGWPKSGVINNARRVCVLPACCRNPGAQEEALQPSTSPGDGDPPAACPGLRLQGLGQDPLSDRQKKEVARVDAPNANSKLLSGSPSLRGPSPHASNGSLTASPAEQQM